MLFIDDMLLRYNHLVALTLSFLLGDYGHPKFRKKCPLKHNPSLETRRLNYGI